MTNRADFEAEPHPLEIDYETRTDSPRQKQEIPRLRLAGTIIFAAGFVSLFLAAVALGNYPGNKTVEQVVSVIHGLAATAIVVGGCLIIAAYRLPAVKVLLRQHVKAGKDNELADLLVWNAGGFIAIIAFGWIGTWILPPALVLLALMVGICWSCSLLVTAALLNRGTIRFYAVGALVSIVMLMLLNVMLVFGFFPTNVYQGNSLISFPLLGLTELATVQLGGVLSVLYARTSGTEKADHHRSAPAPASPDLVRR